MKDGADCESGLVGAQHAPSCPFDDERASPVASPKLVCKSMRVKDCNEPHCFRSSASASPVVSPMLVLLLAGRGREFQSVVIASTVVKATLQL